MHEVNSYNSMLSLQTEWTPAFIFGVYSYASDMMLKFAPSLADSYLSSALLEQRTDLFHKKEDFEYLIKNIELGNIDYKKKCYFIIINVDEKKMHILNNYKLLKYISGSKSRYIKFFSN